MHSTRPYFGAMAVAFLLLMLPRPVRSEETGPVLYWAFEGRSRDVAVDATGNDHGLLLSGTKRVPGAIGGGLRFSGDMSRAHTPLANDLQSPTAVTVQAWVRPDEFRKGVEGAGVVYAGNYLIRITRGAPSFHVFTTGWKPVLAKGTFLPGTWYCLVGTYDGTEMRIYVNGQLAGSSPRVGSIPASDRPLVLGRQANAFEGTIDEVKIHRRCLSAEEIRSAFAADLAKQKSGETWVSPHVGRKDALVPPPELAILAATPLPTGSVPMRAEGVLALRQAPAQQPTSPSGARHGLRITPWPPDDTLGCLWRHVWPLPSSRAGWRALTNALTESQGKGQHVALPLPMHQVAMNSVWNRLEPFRQNIGAIVVCNGMPDTPRALLASWRSSGTPTDWAEACTAARSKVPKETKVFLARIPLPEHEDDEQMRKTMEAIRGKAQGIHVSLSTQDAPEGRIESALQRVRSEARRAELKVCLDAEGWESDTPVLRAAYLLRLLAICQALDIRLTWWPANGSSNALLDADGNPTSLHDVIQAWQRTVGPGKKTQLATDGNMRRLTWEDSDGIHYMAWWRPDGNVLKIGRTDSTFPRSTKVVDPLYGRTMAIPRDMPPPLCAWPLIARLPGPVEPGQ
ncbi:MAG: LamG domain-containing protein [Lentisphaerae bacterium]|jgi:hypothetical protein|nr:LamG domain-containing protein [Lentisphaerota bacterium]MBT4820837.1 LamG domain-containing protein [Lentisphaerota bacterium]MBT5612271.1 LamG domain-containing protein [Lentisphaerota bacterium]MBT7060751.1 LamG domain-containing protein [Lentisphaerota bacterium]MBT7845250.1 LamG domain-containing protein [Lentisphaerota bacterium]